MSLLHQAKGRVRQYLARRLHLPEIPVALSHLVRQGLKCTRIVDVGAYRGDFARTALERWPDAQVLCIEPQRSKRPELEALALERPEQIVVCPVLVGAEERDEVVLHEAETASSVLDEHTEQGHAAVTHRMRTVDDLVAEHFQGQPCQLLKLDVQGYELEVLKGAERCLMDLDVILAELNFLDLHIEVPLAHQVMSWLAERDFVTYDICGLTRRPLDGALWQADLVFARTGGILRRDKRWAPYPVRHTPPELLTTPRLRTALFSSCDVTGLGLDKGPGAVLLDALAG